MTARQVTVYTVPNCADCMAVKRFLTAHGVAYTERDVRSDDAARAEMIRVANVRIAPVTVIDGQVFYGEFDAQRPKLEALLHAGSHSGTLPDRAAP